MIATHSFQMHFNYPCCLIFGRSRIVTESLWVRLQVPENPQIPEDSQIPRQNQETPLVIQVTPWGWPRVSPTLVRIHSIDRTRYLTDPEHGTLPTWQAEATTARQYWYAFWQQPEDWSTEPTWFAFRNEASNRWLLVNESNQVCVKTYPGRNPYQWHLDPQCSVALLLPPSVPSAYPVLDAPPLETNPLVVVLSLLLLIICGMGPVLLVQFFVSCLDSE